MDSFWLLEHQFAMKFKLTNEELEQEFEIKFIFCPSFTGFLENSGQNLLLSADPDKLHTSLLQYLWIQD